MHLFLKVLLLSFTNVLGKNDQLKKYLLQKSHEHKVVSDFAIWAQQWFKIGPLIKVFKFYKSQYL